MRRYDDWRKFFRISIMYLTLVLHLMNVSTPHCLHTALGYLFKYPTDLLWFRFVPKPINYSNQS